MKSKKTGLDSFCHSVCLILALMEKRKSSGVEATINLDFLASKFDSRPPRRYSNAQEIAKVV